MMKQQVSSPFLPFVPAVADFDRGRVVFPGTTQAGRGLLTLADRNPNEPMNSTVTTGPSTYTRQPDAHSIRVGGLFPPVIYGEPRPAGRRRDIDD